MFFSEGGKKMELSIKTLEDYIQQFLTSQQLQEIDYSNIETSYLNLAQRIEQLCMYASTLNDSLESRYDPDSKKLVQLFDDLNTELQKLQSDKLNEHLFIPMKKLEGELRKLDMYYAEIHKQSEITAAYRHDRRNHIFCISALLSENKVEEAMEYLDDLNQVQHGIFVIRTGNLVLDILLSEKIRLAKEYAIQTKTVIHIPADIPLHPADWTTIFANLMDNAIEAASQIPDLEERKINITLKYKEGYLSARITNTFITPPKLENNNLITHKEDSEEHGLGIRSVKRAIEKYNGVMNITFDNNLFTVTLMLDTTSQLGRST